MNTIMNENYPLLLNYDTYATLNFNNYNLNTNPTTDDNTKALFPLSFLNRENTSPVYIGTLTYYGISNKLTNVPIDMLINKSVIEDLVSWYNKQDPNNYTLNNLQFNLAYSNFYDALKFATVISNDVVATDINNDFTRFSKLYDLNYSKYIYRAKKTKSQEVFSGTLTTCIPIFSLKYEASTDIQAYVFIRNIPIPFKRFKTSENNYIFIYPEYLLAQYKQYLDSFQKIVFTSTGNPLEPIENKITIYYSNLEKLGNNDNLVPSSSVYTDARNTYSNKTLFSYSE